MRWFHGIFSWKCWGENSEISTLWNIYKPFSVITWGSFIFQTFPISTSSSCHPWIRSCRRITSSVGSFEFVWIIFPWICTIIAVFVWVHGKFHVILRTCGSAYIIGISYWWRTGNGLQIFVNKQLIWQIYLNAVLPTATILSRK